MGKPTHFTIYTKGAGKAQPEVHFSGAAKGDAVRDFEIIDNHNYSYTVRYTAVQQVRFMGFKKSEPTEELMLTAVCVPIRGTCPSLCVTEETPSLKAHLTSAWPPRWTSTRSKFRV